MAIKGLSFGEREAYFMREDVKSLDEGGTPFYLQNIPSAVQSRLFDMQSSATVTFGESTQQTVNNRTSARNREAFRFGIGGWDNFNDSDDKPIPYETREIMEGGRTYRVITEETMDRIPLSVVNEVGDEVFRRNTMT